MKKIIALSISILTLTLFTGCKKKYDDGPLVSLRSRAERVANVWQVATVLKNGSDVTGNYENYEETYEKEGTFSYTYNFGGVAFSGSGKWMFQNNDEEIKRYDVSAQDDRILYILKLEEKEFWYYYYDGTDKFEVRLKSKT